MRNVDILSLILGRFLCSMLEMVMRWHHDKRVYEQVGSVSFISKGFIEASRDSLRNRSSIDLSALRVVWTLGKGALILPYLLKRILERNLFNRPCYANRSNYFIVVALLNSVIFSKYDILNSVFFLIFVMFSSLSPSEC